MVGVAVVMTERLDCMGRVLVLGGGDLHCIALHGVVFSVVRFWLLLWFFDLHLRDVVLVFVCGYTGSRIPFCFYSFTQCTIYRIAPGSRTSAA